MHRHRFWWAARLAGAAGLLAVVTPGALAGGAAAEAASRPSGEAVAALRRHLQMDAEKRPPLKDQAFAKAPLTREDARAAERLLWDDHAARIRRERAGEMKEKRLRQERPGDGQPGDGPPADAQLEMPFDYRVFGDKPAGGRSLFVSLHGGGNAPKAVNDRQWENQKRLYRPAEGVYLAPRAPTNTWNLWHEAHVDAMLGRLIENLVVFVAVDPNRVYLMGYSAGGDGVYQLAPRTADRWAAAAMMAGHPNEASPLGLRNLPFAVHVGERDGGYNRNKVAAEWGQKLDALRKDDPEGYAHVLKLHAGKGHWMDGADAEAVPWMAGHTRDPLPRRVVWKQDDVTHARFYWLAVPPDAAKAGAEVRASLDGQRVSVETGDATRDATGDPDRLLLRFNDRMLNLDKPLTVLWSGRPVFEGTPPRTIATLAQTLAERGDPAAVFCSEVEVRPPAARQ